MDYGCGDGTFLYFVNKLFKVKVGMEIDSKQLNDLVKRFKEMPSYKFIHISEIPTEQFDIVTCFEVLEHCTDENLERILNTVLKQCCKHDGHIIISVPNETGLTMIGKQLVRKILAYRRIGSYEYTEWYNVREFFTMLFATETSQINRSFYDIEIEGVKYKTCGHKGFNWKMLKHKISDHFTIEKIEFSPNWLPFGILASQVWFICRPK
jgi:2-polyprenyl-3-methyl-5-hydroxy-6-metoxy-1,4-benzoquinol methylase